MSQHTTSNRMCSFLSFILYRSSLIFHYYTKKSIDDLRKFAQNLSLACYRLSSASHTSDCAYGSIERNEERANALPCCEEIIVINIGYDMCHD
jgi:hypothetical protein